MKKRCLFLCTLVALCAMLVLTGCGASYSKIKVTGTQDPDYTVYSNGGNAVQYGNYVYFINGTRGYEDADGKNNVWGNVTKGGLYRAELRGQKGNDGEFSIIGAESGTVTAGQEFVSTIGQDYDGNDVDVVSVQLIAPKTIGTSGYGEGGIFVYDEFVYYASPNNEKDKSGNVQVSKTDYFRTKLDGSKTEKLYTTKSDSATTAYNFYKYGEAVYLVCIDGSDVVSVKTDRKVGKPVTLAQGVLSAYLPHKSVYKKGMHTNAPEDFVYIVRSPVEGESYNAGRVIEIMRPDGKSGGTYYTGTDTDVTAIEAVRDGLLFYVAKGQDGNTQILFDNLHDFLLSTDSEYKAYHENPANQSDTIENGVYPVVKRNIDGAISRNLGTALSTTYPSRYCFRPGGADSDQVYMLAAGTSAAQLMSNFADAQTVYGGSMTISFLEGNDVYFTTGDSAVLYRTQWNKSVDEKTESELQQKVSSDNVTSTGLKADYCAGYVVYMGKVDDWADGYALFQPVARAEGRDPVFVGSKIEADLKPEEEDDEEDEQEAESGCGSAVDLSSATGTAGMAMLMLGAGILMVTLPRRKKS